MGKQSQQRKLADNEAKVFVNNIRTSPQKLGLVIDVIRGMKVDEAMAQLTFMKKRVSNIVKAALTSAVANAENNHGLDIDNLIVSEVWVGKALVMKRFRARARGRGVRILKPFSNLTIIVKEVE
jgi:large subunit ribosomal protein L22